MRNIKLFMIICSALIVVCLTGCSGHPTEKSPYLDVPVLQGVELYMDQTVYPRDVEEITFYLENKTGEEFLYGDDWRLETLYEDEWYKVEMRMSCSVAGALHITKPDAVHEITNSFYCYKRPLQKGRYRFIHYNHLYKNVIVIEFQIE